MHRGRRRHHRAPGHPLTVYIGFDPTADSFGVGNLVPIRGLYWLRQCGHTALALVGGATGLVGDPSGKTEMRKMLTREDIAANCAALAAQLSRLLGGGVVELINNADWLARLGWIDLLREAGPHLSVNRMLTMDSVKGRMADGGISFLEFNYMVMQAYDYLHLARTRGCTLQLGGQDQWGNIVMGIELARRIEDRTVAGLTFPLVTRADGRKFGKSEQGNIWLSQARTPVYDFFQFWRNVDDADVRRYLGYFTALPMEQIDAACAPAGPGINRAKELLAYEMTRWVHGQVEADQARADAAKAFGADQDPTGSSIPHEDLAASEISQGVGVVQLLVRSSLVKTTSDGRRLIEAKGLRIHDRLVETVEDRVAPGDIRQGYVLLRAGKKRLFRFDVRG